MKTKFVFVYLNHQSGKPEAHATIDVSGLGEVKIVHALSEELCTRIHAESLAALRKSFGQTCATIKKDKA